MSDAHFTFLVLSAVQWLLPVSHADSLENYGSLLESVPMLLQPSHLVVLDCFGSEGVSGTLVPASGSLQRKVMDSSLQTNLVVML